MLRLLPLLLLAAAVACKGPHTSLTGELQPDTRASVGVVCFQPYQLKIENRGPAAVRLQIFFEDGSSEPRTLGPRVTTLQTFDQPVQVYLDAPEDQGATIHMVGEGHVSILWSTEER